MFFLFNNMQRVPLEKNCGKEKKKKEKKIKNFKVTEAARFIDTRVYCESRITS